MDRTTWITTSLSLRSNHLMKPLTIRLSRSARCCMVAACSREQLTIRAVRSPIIRISRDIETPRSSCPLTHTRPHGRSSRLDVRDALRFTWLLKRTFLRSAYVDRPQSHNVLVRIECLSALIAQDSND